MEWQVSELNNWLACLSSGNESTKTAIRLNRSPILKFCMYPHVARRYKHGGARLAKISHCLSQKAAVTDDIEQLQACVEALAAREVIRDVLYRYCRAVDRGDTELLKSCYHPDARDDHGFFSGRAWDFADYVMPILAQLELSIHSLSNPLIELDGNRATVETHWSVIHRLRRGTKLTDIWDQGRYLDEFECRDGEWRIFRRVVVMDAERWSDTLNFLDLVRSDDPHRVYTGQRGKSDPVHRRYELSALVRPDFRLPDLWGIYRRLLRTPRYLLRLAVRFVIYRQART